MRYRPPRPRRSLSERLYSFMIGRNGADALGNALFITYLVLFVVNLVLSPAIVTILDVVKKRLHV
jgi:hypothetical protein